MHLLVILIIGLVVGALARVVLPGDDPGGILATSAIGVLGSVLAHIIGRLGGWYGPHEHAGLIASVIGAVLMLALWRAIVRRLPPPRDLPPASE